MKSLICISLIFCVVVIYSCSRNPVSTASLPYGSQTVSLNDYGANLDSTYYKVWSDSTWEAFDMDTTISGTTYAVVADYSGYLYFYGPNGYSGFWPYGGSLIMFDSVLASPPDSMVEGTTYTMKTTFTSLGINYVLKDQETPIDTATVATPFGTFTNCLWFQSTISITGGGQTTTSTTQYWYAKGPSDIQKQFSTGGSIFMAYGVVNGQGWGVTSGSAAPDIQAVRRKVTIARQNAPGFTTQSVQDMQSLAPKILKGVLLINHHQKMIE